MSESCNSRAFLAGPAQGRLLAGALGLQRALLGLAQVRLLSPLPGGALPASRLTGPEDVLLPFAPGSGRRRGRTSGG
ncbi:hypothetical protein LMJ43_15420 [Streptomyces rochei]|nr:hypothetical protein [Streptomyces rochei]MCC8451685.1 hypothetical protein [Streptomyces rochei]